MSIDTLICAATRFEAARRIGALPDGHPSSRLHGHGFVAQVRCALPALRATFEGGEVQRLQQELSAAVAPLDHHLLNDHVALPTDANLARWIFEHARLQLPQLDRVDLYETDGCGAIVSAHGAVLALPV